jgi:ParB/RepB/Spo0J family partition protein
MERTELPVDALVVDPLQSRDAPWSGDKTDYQLAESIDSNGLFNDLLVRPLSDVDVGVTTDTHDITDDGQDMYGIVAGSRRYHAAMEAGHETVSCKIINADDLDAAWASLLENTDRRDLSEQEIAQQLNLIYQLIRPKQTDESDDSNSDTEYGRFDTEKEALAYMAEQYCGRSDESAISHIQEHLETAALPPVLQSLFENADERTTRERTILKNHGIDTQSKLGSGEGKSGTSRAVVALHNTLEEEIDTDNIDPTDAVLETIGSLQFDEMSELELRQSLREFRVDVSNALDAESASNQRDAFTKTLQRHREELRELHEEVEPNRPFKRVDLQGPDTQRHSRWHVQAMRERGVDTHTELARELYLERLENLAEERGWV